MSISTFISRTLIIIGAALVLVFVSFETYNYPWKTVFSRDMPQYTGAEPLPPALPDGLSVSEFDWDAQSGYTGKADASALLVSDRFLSPPYAYVYGFDNTDIVRLGTLKIPILDVSVNLFDGISAQLEYGPARAAGSALPGEIGNCVITAGRQYIKMRPFRYIDKLIPGDNIIIETGGGTFIYSVYDSLVVTPQDYWVLEPADEPYTLTLVTCTTLANPVNRLIVRARLDSVQ